MQYDGEKLEATPRFIAALRELMDAQMEMMRLHHPEYADCWSWGECRISDMCSARPFEFSFGDDEVRPYYIPEGETTYVMAAPGRRERGET